MQSIFKKKINMQSHTTKKILESNM